MFQLSGQAKFFQQRPLGCERLLSLSTTGSRSCPAPSTQPTPTWANAPFRPRTATRPYEPATSPRRDRERLRPLRVRRARSAGTRQQTIDWRAADEARNNERAKLNQLILDCRAAGISFERIRNVTGLGIATIQMVIAKAGQ